MDGAVRRGGVAAAQPKVNAATGGSEFCRAISSSGKGGGKLRGNHEVVPLTECGGSRLDSPDSWLFLVVFASAAVHAVGKSRISLKASGHKFERPPKYGNENANPNADP